MMITTLQIRRNSILFLIFESLVETTYFILNCTFAKINSNGKTTERKPRQCQRLLFHLCECRFDFHNVTMTKP